MPDAPNRLNDVMNARRRQLRLEWKDVADAAGLSLSGLGAIRRGERTPRDLTRDRLEDALHWAPGSIDAIMSDGDPIPADEMRRSTDHPDPAVAALGDRLLADLKAHTRIPQRRHVRAIADSIGLTDDEVRAKLEGRGGHRFSPPELRTIGEQLGIGPEAVTFESPQSDAAAPAATEHGASRRKRAG